MRVFLFFYFFEWDERERHAEEAKKRGARDGGGVEGALAGLWAGEGPKRSLQTLVIPLLLM